jgi:hypothetical protein
MFMTKTKVQTASLLMGLSLSLSSGFAATAARAVGSGIVFPTLNHATVLNPAGLAESPSASLQGLYDFDGHNIFGSATVGQNGFGAGFDYTHLNGQNTSNEHFGVGAKLSSLMLGMTLNSVEFGNFDFGVGASFDFSKFRLSAVMGGLKGGPDNLSVGAGVDLGMWGVELDVERALGSGSSSALNFNAGLHAKVSMISLGGGYKFSLDGSDFSDQGFWAGLSVEVTHHLSIEGFYKAGGTALALGDWSAGARFQF